MKHIYVDTKELIWAVAIAGVAEAAKKKKVNDEFKLTFNPTTPAMSFLADSFDQAGPGMVEFKIPTPDEFETIDVFGAKRQALELQHIFNIRTETINVQPLPIASLATNAMLQQFGILGAPAYYYPKPSKNQSKVYEGYHGVATNERNVQAAKAFLQGFGILEPNVLNMDGMDELEQVKAVNASSIKVACLDPIDPIMSVLRAFYKGYDRMSENLPILVVFPTDRVYDIRYFVSWTAHIPMYDKETDEATQEKGKAWAVRTSVGHDHHKYRQWIAKMRKQHVQPTV